MSEIKKVELIPHEYGSEMLATHAWDIFSVDRTAASLGGFCVVCTGCEEASIVSHKDFALPRLFICPFCESSYTIQNAGEEASLYSNVQSQIDTHNVSC